MEIFVTYNESCGVFENGIPARDLTEAEWLAVDEETRKRLLKAGVYKLAKKAKKEGE